MLHYFVMAILFIINCITPREYITGNQFRACADYHIDAPRIGFNPANISSESIIYIKTDFLEYFFTQVFPQLTHPVTLITHNSDYSAPGKFSAYLDDPKIIRWYGQNCDFIHPKFIPIPIGIANAEWAHGNPRIFDQILDQLKEKRVKKKHKLYINFAATNPLRPQLMKYFENTSFVEIVKPKPFRDYLLEMSRYQFILSPFGNGLDCHRTWEALLVGSIPVVKSSTLDALYKDLPVIIVENWSDINWEILEQKRKNLKNKRSNSNKLYMEYWRNKIKSKK